MQKASGLHLVPVSLTAPPGLETFLHEFEAGENGFSGSRFRLGDSLPQYLQNLVDMAEGKNLSEGRVPSTTFWLLDERGSVVGVARLRHGLTPRLLDDGGHIGYYLARSERGRGLGIELLKLTVEAAHAMSISPLLLTVSSDNVPSIRVSAPGRCAIPRRG